MQFEHTITTSAPPEAIWALWTDVGGWPRWDTPLEWARLDGPFALNVTGRLKSRGSPDSAFTISQVDPGHSYTFTTALPLARLDVRRELGFADAQTCFTHRVSFSGPLGWLFGRVLGPGFQRQLPAVMERLRDLAEQASLPRLSGASEDDLARDGRVAGRG